MDNLERLVNRDNDPEERIQLDFCQIFLDSTLQGRIQGEGGFWGSPPPFLGTPKLQKEGKNVARVLVLNSYADPPLSEILYPPLHSPSRYCMLFMG